MTLLDRTFPPPRSSVGSPSVAVVPLRSGAAEARRDRGGVCPRGCRAGGAARGFPLATEPAGAALRAGGFRLQGRCAGVLSGAQDPAGTALRASRARRAETGPAFRSAFARRRGGLLPWGQSRRLRP